MHLLLLLIAAAAAAVATLCSAAPSVDYASLDGDFHAAPGPSAGVASAGGRGGAELFTLNRLDDYVERGARCLDGGPGAYYFRPARLSGVNKFYIHHEGGGWCRTPHGCAGRAKTRLGSTKDDNATEDIGWAYFSQSPRDSPFAHWNAVYLRYCDGASFAGNNASVDNVDGNELYYRGWPLLQAMFDHLVKQRRLGAATDVVVSGCSAGGLAAFLHADWWAAQLRDVAPAARVRALPDSGFFLDYDSPREQRYSSSMRYVFEFQNATAGVDQDCVAHFAPRNETFRCFFAQHTLPFLTTPVFVMESMYDSWQLPNVLDSAEPPLVNAFGRNITDTLEAALLPGSRGDRNGGFVTSCSTHCGVWGKVVGGFRVQDMFEDWYQGGAAGVPSYTRGANPFPCESCCDADDAPSVQSL